jgi:tetratricopeptide (TPR) repeat protein
MKRPFFALGCLLLSGLTLAQSPLKLDPRVDPTTSGKVVGRIYDVDTGYPLKGVTVRVEGEKGFVQKGPGVAETGPDGRYGLEAVIGRVRSNFDVGRALASPFIGLLFGSATNTTRRIDVTRVVLQVEAKGYRTFEGVVPARRLDAGRFEIELEPILLSRQASGEPSFVGLGWTAVRLAGVTAKPAIAKPGEPITVEATVKVGGRDAAKATEVVATSALWRGEKRLAFDEKSYRGGDATYRLEVRTNAKEKKRAEAVTVLIKRSAFDYRSDGREYRTLVQVAIEPDDAEVAQLRQQAFEEMNAGQTDEAVRKWRTLADRSASAFDFRMVAQGSEQLADYSTMVQVLQKVYESPKDRRPDDFLALTRAYYLAKDFERVPKIVDANLAGVSPEDLPRRVPPQTMAYLGLSYLRLGALKEAEKVSEDLSKWPFAGLDPVVIEFRQSIRLSQVEAEIAKNPASPVARANLGRAYLDMGRIEEAVANLKLALDADAEQPAVRRDLAFAASRVLGADAEPNNLDQAIQDARFALNLDAKGQVSKDFFSWNRYALLQLQKGIDSPTPDTLSALRESVSLGRLGADWNSGALPYFGMYLVAGETLIAGYAYPEAGASFNLYRSMQKLAIDPQNPYARFDRAAALLDLNQLRLAQTAIKAYRDVRPDDADGMFLEGLWLAKRNRTEQAKEMLQKVLKVNPRHPRANLILAEIYTEDGDAAGAAERLAAHAKWYGDFRFER